MIGSLLQFAKQDAAFIASNGGFQVDVMLSTPTNSSQQASIAVTGLATGTWFLYDDTNSGKTTNSSSDSFTVHDSLLIAGNYPYKKNGITNLIDHIVVLNDGAAMSGTFVIKEQHPNRTTGLLVCILGNYTP